MWNFRMDGKNACHIRIEEKLLFSEIIIEILVYGLEFFECIRFQAEEVGRGQVFLA